MTQPLKHSTITFVEVQNMNSMKAFKTKKRFINVNPKSSKAKNRFVNQMDSLHAMEVEQDNGNELFVVSINRRYCFWLNKEGDPHWNILS